jgi:hypothetical protein
MSTAAASIMNDAVTAHSNAFDLTGLDTATSDKSAKSAAARFGAQPELPAFKACKALLASLVSK